MVGDVWMTSLMTLRGEEQGIKVELCIRGKLFLQLTIGRG